MSGKNLLLDTNILIYLSKGEIQLSSIMKENDSISISVISYMEALGFPFKESKEKEIMEQICDIIPIIYIEENVVQEVISIRKRKKIKLPDAIILATAYKGGYTLLTRNMADFEAVYDSLPILNPFA